MILQVLRFSGVVFLILGFLLVSSCLHLLVPKSWGQGALMVQVMGFFSGLGLKVLGIRVQRRGQIEEIRQKLIVCNHLSYLDVLILAHQVRTCFVTSVEIRETVGLGALCRVANCLFVERRHRERLESEVQELTRALQAGLNVTIFPEATSTNGDQVLRFRRPLYRSAIEAGVGVKPLCLNYKMIAGKPLTRENRDLVFWYGDMTFVDHLWRVAGLGHVEVELAFLSEQSVAPHRAQESTLAERTHQIVSQTFRPCPS